MATNDSKPAKQRMSKVQPIAVPAMQATIAGVEPGANHDPRSTSNSDYVQPQSRDVKFVINDLVRSVSRFSKAEKKLIVFHMAGCPTSIPVFELEKKLVSAAHRFERLFSEYSNALPYYDRARVRSSLRVQINSLHQIIQERLQKWKWEFVLNPGGLQQVEERIEEHKKTTYYRFLDAVLSWQLGTNFDHALAAEFADDAEASGIEPTMTPEEGERVVWDLYTEWQTRSVLADTMPDISDEEHVELVKALKVAEFQLEKMRIPKGSSEITACQQREAQEQGGQVDAGDVKRPPGITLPHVSPEARQHRVGQPPEADSIDRYDGERQTQKGPSPSNATKPRPRNPGRKPKQQTPEETKFIKAWDSKRYSGYSDCLKECGLLGKMTHKRARQVINAHQQRLRRAVNTSGYRGHGGTVTGV